MGRMGTQMGWCRMEMDTKLQNRKSKIQNIRAAGEINRGRGRRGGKVDGGFSRGGERNSNTKEEVLEKDSKSVCSPCLFCVLFFKVSGFSLWVCYLLQIKFSISLLSQCCAYALVRFRHKNHLVRVWKTSGFDSKCLFSLSDHRWRSALWKIAENGWKCQQISLET